MENVVGNLWIQISVLPLTHCLTCGSLLAQSLWASTLRAGVGSPQFGRLLEDRPFTSSQGAALQLALIATRSRPGARCGSFLTKCTSCGLWGQGKGPELHLYILCLPREQPSIPSFSFIGCSSSTLVCCVRQVTWVFSSWSLNQEQWYPFPHLLLHGGRATGTAFSRHQAHLFIQPAHSLQEAGTGISPFYK